MKDEDKTRDQLIRELQEIRLRISELEKPHLRKQPPRALLDQAGKAKHPEPENMSAADLPEYGMTPGKVLESPLKWITIFNSVTDAICLLDMEGRVLDCNAAMLKFLGKPAGEVIGNTCWSLMHGSSGPIDACPITRMRESMSKESLELSLNGRWFDVFAHPITDEAGNLIGAVHVITDITKRKEAEAALKRSEEKYRELVEAANSIILRMDSVGNITFINEFAQSFFGYSESEALGRNVVGTIVPEVESTGRDLRSMIEDIGRNPHSYVNNVNENMRRNGERVWVAWTNKPILDDKGQVLEILCIGNDITERKRAEEELQKLASVVRYSSELINLATLDGKMIFLNDAGAKVLGIDPQEVEQTHIMQVIPDHLKEKVETEVLPALMTEGAWKGDLQSRNLKTGKLTNVHTVAFTIKDPETGTPLFLANVSRDISKRKQAEESLRQSEEKFSKAFQANPSLMTICRLEDGSFIDVNESFLKASGYTRGEVIGRTVKELGLLEQDALDCFTHLLKTMERVHAKETQLRTKTGDLLVALVSAEMIKIDGEPCVLVVADDITERKRAESAFQESRQQLFDIIDFLPDATLVVDLRGTVIAWNRAMEEMTGIRKGEILGSGKDALAVAVYGQPGPILVDFVLQSDLGFQGTHDHVERRGHTLYTEVCVHGNLGGSRYISATASPLYDRDGKVAGAIQSMRDITERKEMEAALLEREKELEAKSLDLEEINTALKVLLKNREEDQKEFGVNILANLKELVFPYVQKLKESRLNEMQNTYVNILESHLLEVRAPFLRQLSSGFANLSPVERQIASLIRDGRRNKEISEILGVSLNTISTHRYHLRTKLGLKNKNINLVSYLQSLDTM